MLLECVYVLSGVGQLPSKTDSHNLHQEAHPELGISQVRAPCQTCLKATPRTAASSKITARMLHL